MDDHKKQLRSRFAALFHAHKKLCVILIIAIVVMMISAAYYLGTMMGQRGGSQIGLTTDPNAVTMDEEYLNSLNDGQTSIAQQDYFIHHCFADLYFKSGQVEQEMPVWNDTGNSESMVVALYVTGSDEPIFTSGLIKPGMMLQSITLSHSLTPGDYKATVVSTPVDAANNEGCSLSSVVEIHVE